MWEVFVAGAVAGFLNGLLQWSNNRLSEPEEEDDYQPVQPQGGDDNHRRDQDPSARFRVTWNDDPRPFSERESMENRRIVFARLR